MVDPTIVGGVISALALILVAQVKRSGDRDSARGPDWQAYADQQSQDMRSLKEEMEAIRGKMQSLESRLDKMERKYRVAIDFIRNLLGIHPQHREDTPEEIKADL